MKQMNKVTCEVLKKESIDIIAGDKISQMWKYTGEKLEYGKAESR